MRKQIADIIEEQIEWVIFSDEQPRIGKPREGIGYLDDELVHWVGEGAVAISLRQSVAIARRVHETIDEHGLMSSSTPWANARWLSDLENDLSIAESAKN